MKNLGWREHSTPFLSRQEVALHHMVIKKIVAEVTSNQKQLSKAAFTPYDWRPNSQLHIAL